MPPAVFEHRLTVAQADVDELGHASNIVYLKWMQDAAVAHSAAVGLDADAYGKLGAVWVVRRHEIEYLRPARLGDAVVVRTWVATMDKVTSLRRHEVRNEGSGELLARAATLWAYLDSRRARPVRIPAEVAGRFPLVADPSESL